MTDQLDRELGFIETVMHAVRLQQKADKLQAQASATVQVAIDLMADIDTGMLEAAVANLREANVHGRRPLTDELHRRLTVGWPTLSPGTSVRRHRDDPAPWPWSPAWVYVLIESYRDLPRCPSCEGHHDFVIVDHPRGDHLCGCGLIFFAARHEVHRCICRGRTVLYVGKTAKHPRYRLAAHADRGIPWTEVELIACATEADALSLEGDLIFQHQPPWNRADTRRRRKPAERQTA